MTNTTTINFETATKKDLLAEAKRLGIKGGHDMNKADLKAAITREIVGETGLASTDVIKAASKRTASTKARDEAGNVIRKGRNLSGNVPWRLKPYFADVETYGAEAMIEMAKSLAPQAQLILKSMIDNEITSVDAAMSGTEIVDMAKADGLKSKIGSAELFAYYARKLEMVGVVAIA